VTPSRPAGLWRRGVAALLDLALGLAVWGLAAGGLLAVARSARAAPRDGAEVLLLAGAVLGLGVALHLVYHVVFTGGCGQTPGRMATGIAVVARDGARPGYGRALLRCLGGWLSVLTLGLGHVGVLATRERPGLADWLAGTRVVRAGLPGGRSEAPEDRPAT
jgi:uncharacterized RDD family membrane protein YckC